LDIKKAARRSDEQRAAFTFYLSLITHVGLLIHLGKKNATTMQYLRNYLSFILMVFAL
jgi:hypothetical protein